AGRSTGVSQTVFYALPALNADTLAFLPIADQVFQGMGARTVPSTWMAAVRRGRELALALSNRWVQRFPQSAEGWLQHAIALELNGGHERSATDRSADMALDRIPRDSLSGVLRARVQVVRTRLALRRGEIGAAISNAKVALQDTLNQPAAVRTLVAPLAALVGDLPRLRAYASDLRSEYEPLPSVLADTLLSFRLNAVHGSCNSLAAQRNNLETAFRSGVASAEQPAFQQTWLLPVLRRAVPCLGPGALDGVSPRTPLDSVVVAVAKGNVVGARQALAEVRARREGASVGTLTWDYLFEESWALLLVGDTVTARIQLADALANISTMSQFTLDHVDHASGLRRGILLLRDLSTRPPSGRERVDVERVWRLHGDVLVQRQNRK
ncbi:MAG: hypothetical protein IT353_01410, partial [Gemmatimonadaceae bacterium]|nr:hypothetical protein [Gemmatimonadaceae bacterium]